MKEVRVMVTETPVGVLSWGSNDVIKQQQTKTKIKKDKEFHI